MQGRIETWEALAASALDLVRSVYPPRLGIRLVGVTLSNFEKGVVLAEPAAQLQLG